jgi:hypothetical protein
MMEAMMNRIGESVKRRIGDQKHRHLSPILDSTELAEVRFSLSPILILLLLAGCTSQTGPDSNTGVFKTPEAAVSARKEKLLLDWQEMAARIANAERPDIKTIKARQGFALVLSADGVEQTIDLSPLSEKLASAAGKEREPIRAYLGMKVPEFDRARLKALGFARARPMLFVYLANSKQTVELTAPDTTKVPISNRVTIDLNWVPVVRWAGSPAQTPIDPEMAGAWKVSEEQVNAGAMENLRKYFGQVKQPPFDNIDLPGLGHYGTLSSGVDPAVLLLPEFLAAVRKEWKTQSDLVVSFPSRITVNFLERNNEKLLNRMIPEWSSFYAKVSEPMVGLPLLLGDKGLSVLNYTPPSTRPATAPATKPRVYIVH